MRKSNKQRIAAGLLTLVVVFSAAFFGFGSTMTAEAADACTNENLLVNPGFEEEKAFVKQDSQRVGNWYQWQSANKTTDDSHSGETSVKITASDSGVEQDIEGMMLNRTYVYTIWARLTKATTAEHIVGVKNFGPAQKAVQVDSTEWKQYEIEFTYTGGTPRVFGYVGTHDGADMYIDDACLTLKNDIEGVNIESVNIENGSIEVILETDPTASPTADAFTWEYKVDDGKYKELSVADFTYDSQSKTVSVSFDKMRGAEEQTVTVKVTYGEFSKEAEFAVEASKANTYYVDSTKGDDANDGLTPETAIASIDKLNTINFIPGDQILFKKGETFVGCFKPQGSGTETAPIKIASYGKRSARPVLQPGEDWTVEYVMSANAMVENVKVNYVLQFYNVEYWEVSDLELFDPNSEAYLTKGSDKYIGNAENDVYRSGITIQAEDCGTLEHFYIDNVVIHGFHGPGTNIGKTSGGITMNVITNKQRDISNSVPTQINDIRVTNCEIYDVGRTGINFLTPWAFRNDAKWGPFDYGTRGYDYLPYEDFYMANNYIHDVDGDGTIIDNCSGAIVEYNLVTRCCLRPATEGGAAAVGLFNWNSDDTVFQYNEVYDIRQGSGALPSNDSQGIEIDALNDRTWVQYNYVHDNFGGFMMLCNVSDNYRSFDGIVRYNISQDDYAHPRQGLFDIYSANYGTEIYNNTFYLTERALKGDEIFMFSAVGAYDTMKFYNNIFYYDGATPAAINQFGDDVIDWQSNIFYGITNMPVNDNADAPNLNMDPKLVNPGGGGTGKYPGDRVELSSYYLKNDSPAIDSGVKVADDGGRDYFGNLLTDGKTDIGAYEWKTPETLEVYSTNKNVVFSQSEQEITVTDADKISAKTVINDVYSPLGEVNVTVKRGSAVLDDGVRLAEGDIVTAQYEDQVRSYVIKVEKAAEEEKEESNTIPREYTKATAGSEETVDGSDQATNATDGKLNTMWHTDWYDPVAPEDRYLTLEIADDNEYEISGYEYTPRQSQKNGIITEYEIYVSDDNVTWGEPIASGNWDEDNTVKVVEFTQPVTAKYVKLLAVKSVGDFASAAEARLIGKILDTDLPTTPVITASDITETSVKISWTESADSKGILEYILLRNGKKIATFDSDVTSYDVQGLKPGRTYEFAVYAVDGIGKESEESSVSVTIAGEPEETVVTRLFGGNRFDTSFAVAEEYKKLLDVEKFDTVVVATGYGYADALSGSYLAVQKKAPILLADPNNVDTLVNYVKENLVECGKVYILGGTGAVPETVEEKLADHTEDVSRLKGSDRYATNLAILEEAGIAGSEELLVATGWSYADSLSASAVNKPIMLVDKVLTDVQKTMLDKLADDAAVYILGGTAAVSEAVEAELAAYGTVDRVKGSDRFGTSVAIAEKFFGEYAETVTFAYGWNYPDGLCGGPVAAEAGAPVLLVHKGAADAAAEYASDAYAYAGCIFGGAGAVAEETIKAVLGDDIQIVEAKYVVK